MIGIRGYHLEFLIDNASDADLFHQPDYPGYGHIQTTGLSTMVNLELPRRDLV